MIPLLVGSSRSEAAEKLSPERLAEALEHALLSEAAYHDLALESGSFTRLESGTLLSGLNYTISTREDANGTVSINIAFAGTEFKTRKLGVPDGRDVFTDIAQGVGAPLILDQYKDGLAIARDVAKRFQGRNVEITLTGHSLGGGVAEYVSLRTGLRATVFDAAPLGPSLQRDITPDMTTAGRMNILSIVLEGEPVHRLPGARYGEHFEIAPPLLTPGVFDKNVPVLAYIDFESPAKFLKSSVDAALEPWVKRHNMNLMVRALEWEQAYGPSRDAWLDSEAGRAATASWIAQDLGSSIALPESAGVRVLRTTAENFAATVKSLVEAVTHLDDLAAANHTTLAGAAEFLKRSEFRITDPRLTKGLSGLSKLTSLYFAIEDDLRASKGTRFAILRSHTLETAGELGLDVMLPKLFKILQDRKLIKSSYPTFGTIDLLKGASRHIGGGRADIDVITSYLDAATGLAWGGLGLVACGGNANCAAVYQSIGTTLASTLRAVTAAPILAAYVKATGQTDRLIEGWRAIQVRRLYDGLHAMRIEDMYRNEVAILKANGVTPRMIAKLDAEVAKMNHDLIRAKRAMGVDQLLDARESDVELAGIALSTPKLCPPVCGGGPGGVQIDPMPVEVERDSSDLEATTDAILKGRRGKGRSWSLDDPE